MAVVAVVVVAGFPRYHVALALARSWAVVATAQSAPLAAPAPMRPCCRFAAAEEVEAGGLCIAACASPRKRPTYER